MTGATLSPRQQELATTRMQSANPTESGDTVSKQNKDARRPADATEQLARLNQKVRILERRQQAILTVLKSHGNDVLSEHAFMEQNSPDAAWRHEQGAMAESWESWDKGSAC